MNWCDIAPALDFPRFRNVMYQGVYYASWSAQSTRKTKSCTSSSRSGLTGAAAEYEAMADRLLGRQEGGASMPPRATRPTRERRCSRLHALCYRTRPRPRWSLRGNVRALRHIIEMRADAHAESEIATWPSASSCACGPLTSSCSATTSWRASRRYVYRVDQEP